MKSISAVDVLVIVGVFFLILDIRRWIKRRNARRAFDAFMKRHHAKVNDLHQQIVASQLYREGGMSL